MPYSKADELYEKLKKMRALKSSASPAASAMAAARKTVPGGPGLYDRAKKKLNALWQNLKYDWKYGSQDAEKPAGFLTRAFRKTLILTAGTSLLALGVACIGGTWAERSYRNVFRGDEHKLTLTVDATRSADKVAPLYVGSAEIKRTIAMQEDLLTLGFPLSACGANGEFQKEDLRAVNWFRASMGMPQGDFADGRTLRILSEQAEARRALHGEFGAASTRQTVLKKSFFNPSLGEKNRIREVQADLFQLGYKIGACKMNGVMNDDVVAAVKLFQQKRDRVLATGEVDYRTKKALHEQAHESLVASGMLDNAKAQGLDDFSAIVYGQQMTAEELHTLAVKYVKERGAPEYVVQAVAEATQKAGFDFVYLMNLASHESGYKPWVGAGTSSAYGNFQFTDSTWLGVFKSYGDKYGYGDLTKKISGGKINASAQEAKYIMDLRNDPKVAALMAIELSKSNLAYLQSNLGGAIGKTDLYMAHFLGPGGAVKFLAEFRKDNAQNAATLFPVEAAANQPVFYDAAGKPRSLGQIYTYFGHSMPGNQGFRMVQAQSPKKLTAEGPKFQGPVA